MGRDRIELDEARRRGETAIRALVAARVPGADIISFGAIDLGPGLLAIWVRTPTDADRDRLKSDAALPAEMRRCLKEAGYPRSAVASVTLAFESGETVNREFGGNWWWAVK